MHRRVYILPGMKTLSERIKFMRETIGKERGHKVTLEEFGTWAGVSKSNVKQWENEDIKNIKSETVFKLEKNTGFRGRWISSGQGPQRVSDREDLKEAGGKYNANIPVPLFDVSASMGKGSQMRDHDTVVNQIQLASSWVRSRLTVTAPNNLAVITAQGDSMTPTFSDGDILLVDRGVVDLRIDAVYVIGLNQELYVKRIQRRPDSRYVMKSDNNLYEPYVLSDDEMSHVRVLGRVLWAWNGRKL